ncbi:MAG: c-type cytochrome, partial [Hyphomicrobiales bacterium]
GDHRVGPNLWDVVGNPIAAAEGYDYSDALQAMSGETWTFEALDGFIHDPRSYAPGTKMAYGGMQRDEQRADLLAYLRSLSDDPEPLPEPSAEEPAEEAAAEEPAAEDAAAEGEGEGIAQLVAAVDPELGQAAARACQACHTFEEGGDHRVGPNLWDVVGQPIARHEDYSYSDALQAMSDQAWTLEALDEFILDPRGFAPGTKMAYGGMSRDEQRIELLSYLHSLSDDPEPLPQSGGAAADDGAEAPATDSEPAAEREPQEDAAVDEPAQEQPATEEADSQETTDDAAAEGEAGGIEDIVAGMDPAEGEAAARACQACHTFEEGGAHRVGPNLWNVVGQPIAHHDDYNYSDALQGLSDQTWTLEALDEFLLNPREFAPGTKMAYGGMRRDEQRHQLLAYLRSLGGDQ